VFFNCAFVGHPSLRTVLRCIPPEFGREEGAPSTVERDIRSKPTGEGARVSMREETDAAKIQERSFRKRRRSHNGERLTSLD
jgi:hypothetical protein